MYKKISFYTIKLKKFAKVWITYENNLETNIHIQI